ncbi:MAG: hypothetical protein ACLUF9_01500 [Oscillospiraceae bacterium]
MTILIKDGYNGIEVTADYQDDRHAGLLLKGAVTTMCREHLRPGEVSRTGDTAGI